MKKLGTFISILVLTLTSCSEHVDLHKENIELRELNIKFQDSLEKLTARPDFAEFPDSLNINTNSGLFGQLYQGDTLVLLAEYADCGEFGGHREWLKIFNEGKMTKLRFQYDSVVCRYQNVGRKYFQIENTEFNLSQAQQVEIQNYLFDLVRMEFLDQEVGVISNQYKAYIRPQKKLLPFYQFHLSFMDFSLNWNHFEHLKKKIKTTANTK